MACPAPGESVVLAWSDDDIERRRRRPPEPSTGLGAGRLGAMDQAIQTEIIQRLAELLGAKTTHMDGGETVVDAARYVDPARFALERDRLFRRHPVAVAHVSQLRDPGDYLTHDGTGTPLVLSRTAEGTITAHV